MLFLIKIIEEQSLHVTFYALAERGLRETIVTAYGNPYLRFFTYHRGPCIVHCKLQHLTGGVPGRPKGGAAA